MLESDDTFMLLAIDAARSAAEAGEVPIGACIVGPDGDILATGHNLTIKSNDPTAHAEVAAIRSAAKNIGNYRLSGSTLYSTIEPFAMCAGAIVNARIKRLVYGAADERFGGIETHFGIGVGSELNHRVDVTAGVLADDCRALMQDFFRLRRK